MKKLNVAITSILVLEMWGFLILAFFVWNDYPYVPTLMTLWLLGTLISCIRKIPVGCVGDVELFGKHRDIWSEGFVLIVPIAPFLLVLNSFFMAIHTRPWSSPVGAKTVVVNEDNFHHMDDRHAQKRVVMRTGALGMLSFSMLQNYFRVVSNVNHPSFFTALSFPVIFLFYVMLGVSTFVAVFNVPSQKIRLSESDWRELRNNKSRTINHVILFDPQESNIPFPIKEAFVERGNGNILEETALDGTRYFFYPRVSPDTTPRVAVEPGACYMVIAGKSIAFQTASPPRYVTNMEPYPKYTPSLEELHGLKRHLANLFKPKSTYASWGYLGYNWQMLDERYPLVTRALSRSVISPNAGGGLVCF